MNGERLRTAWVLPVVATGLLLAASPASAQISVEVNGRAVEFGKVPPARIQGSVLIPLRAVVESLGADIKWDAATQTVRGSKGQREFSLQINSRNAMVNGSPVTLSVAAQLMQGTTMVPLRFVAEALGAEVEWNAAAQQVVINAAAGEEMPGDDRVAGEVVAVRPEANPPTITIRVNGVRNTYEIGADTIILRGVEGKRGRQVDLNRIQTGDQVRVRLGKAPGVAEVVEAIIPAGGEPEPGRPDPGRPEPGRPGRGERVAGEILDIQTRNGKRTLTVRTETGRAVYEIPEEIEISRSVGNRAGTPAELRDLEIGDQVELRTDRRGGISRIDATARVGRPPLDERITGEVVAVRSAGNSPSITVKTEMGRVRYDVPRETIILRGRGNRPANRANLDDIYIGDQVTVTVDRDGQATRIEAKAGSPIPVANGRISGELVSVNADANPPTLTIRSGQDRGTYDIGQDTILFRAVGQAKAVRVRPTELEVGDQLRIRLDDTGTVAEVVEAQAPVGADANPVPAADLKITSFTVDAPTAVRSGSQVRVTLVGSPGAAASFDAGTIGKNVPLKEDPQRPGRYSATLAVPEGVTAKDIPVVAQLKVGNRIAPLVQAGTLLNVDSEAPVIADRAPADKGETTNQQPDIYIEVSDGAGSGIDPDSIRLVVGTRDVTDQVKHTKRFLIYSPRAPFTPGRVPVTLTVKDMAGNVTESSWAFTIKQAPVAIQSVTHDADQALRVGDVVTVTVKGQPRGKGTFSIGDVIRDVPLTETAAGTYTGRYTVRDGDEILKAPVVVEFVSQDGNRSRQEAGAPVNIVTRAASAPEITFPRDTFRIGDDLVVEGTAAPGAKVLVEVTYRGKAFGAVSLKGTLGSQEVTADRRGNWNTPPFDLRLPLGVKKPELTIRAVSIDAAGKESKPTVVTLETR